MQMTIIASREIFEHALSTASRVGESEESVGSGAHAPLDLARNLLNAAWSAIDEALRCAYIYGREQALVLYNTARTTVEESIKQLGEDAEEFQAALLDRLRAYIGDMLTGTISLLPSEYRVGGRAFTMRSIACTQTVMLSGSLKASLERVFVLTSEGSFEIETHYSLE
jgi:hypothetical protein